MNLNQAVEHGKRMGVRFYVRKTTGALMGGTQTREQAEEMLRRFEEDDKRNPWTKGTSKFYIETI